MSLSTVLVGLAFSLWVIPPALLAGSLVSRSGKLWTDDFIAVAACTGFGVLLIGSGVIAALGWLTPTTFWGGGAVLAILSVAGLGLKHRYRPARGITWREIGLVLLPICVAVVASVPVLVTVFTRPDALPSSTPWYYWDLARQTAEIGGLPTTSMEWGQEVSFLREYPGFTGATAGLALASTDPSSLAPAHLFRIVTAAGLGLGVWYLSRAFGANRHGATAATFLIVVTSIFAIKLMSYRPESAGYLPMLLSPALAVRWLDTRRSMLLLSGAIGMTALSLTHGLAWTAGATMVIAVGLAWILTSKASLRDRFARPALLFTVIVGAWLAVAIPLQGGLTGTDQLESLPEVSEQDGDPTWNFASFATSSEGTAPPSPIGLAGDALSRGLFDLPTWALFAVVAAGLLLSLIAAIRGDDAARRALTASGLFLLGVMIVSAFFAINWETYVPRRTGLMRILQIAVFLIPVWLAVGWSRLELLRTSGAKTTLVAIAVGLWGFGVAGLPATAVSQIPSRDSLAQQRELALDGPILTNGWTEGYLSSVFGQSGPLEGRAPYSDPALLSHAISALEQARQFFSDPAGSDYVLDRYNFVMVATRGWAAGTPRVFPVDLEALYSRRDLRLIAEGVSGDWTLFEVNS